MISARHELRIDRRNSGSDHIRKSVALAKSNSVVDPDAGCNADSGRNDRALGQSGDFS
jgi:hypothetical protein